MKAHGASGRTKHFERWITYIRDLFQRGMMKATHIPTDDMPADIFTKPLGYVSFTKFRELLLNS